MPAKVILTTGGLYGLLAVLLGAFAAHGLRDILTPSELSSWQTAVTYQMSHALMLLLTGLWIRQGGPALLKVVGLLLASGVLLFSGSIYALLLLNFSWLGPVTPMGGLLMIAGWACLCVCAVRS